VNLRTEPSAAPPVIGITVYPRVALDDPGQLLDAVDRRYVAAVVQAGGLPVLLPVVDVAHVPALLDRVDGLVLSGGGDLEPARYGRASTATVRDPRPERDASEIALATRAGLLGLPVLGVCRGLQCMNVAYGGTLIQDLGPLVPDHPEDELSVACHEIDVVPGTALHSLVGSVQAKVNSQHHQAVETVASGFAVSAVGPGGVIEAIESTGEWWALGVQWHPEALPDAPETLAVFRELVGQATVVARSRREVSS